jgi:hypothetical protein
MPSKKQHTEWHVEQWAKQHAKNKGWYVRKFTSVAHRSVPDDVFAKGGRLFFVEFKALGKIPTDLQKHEHELLRQAGQTVYVVDSREQFGQILADEEERLNL